MDVNDDFQLEEELSGSEGGGESAGGGSFDTWQETAAKQAKKRRREPTVKIEEKKKTGPKGKAGEGPAGWVRPLYLHNENDRLVRCSPPSLAAAAGKKGGVRYVPDLPSESFLQQIQLDDSTTAHA